MCSSCPHVLKDIVDVERQQIACALVEAVQLVPKERSHERVVEQTMFGFAFFGATYLWQHRGADFSLDFRPVAMRESFLFLVPQIKALLANVIQLVPPEQVQKRTLEQSVYMSTLPSQNEIVDVPAPHVVKELIWAFFCGHCFLPLRLPLKEERTHFAILHHTEVPNALFLRQPRPSSYCFVRTLCLSG